jgi:DNA-binding NarL/FixJ family response regulator
MTHGSEQSGGRPIRVAIMDDYEVVVAGLHSMLASFSNRVHVVELVSQLPVESRVDVVLYDAFSRERVVGPVENVVRETDAKVVVYSWLADPDLVEEALAKGVSGWLSKSLTSEELVAALERVAAGAVVVSDDPGPDAPITEGSWPGKEHGLSPRESEVLALIAQGLSNQEIADRAYVSINSVKTYIRTCYRKIGVQRRTQALLWATKNGFLPARKRFLVDDR